MPPNMLSITYHSLILSCNQKLPAAMALEKLQMFVRYSRLARESFKVGMLQMCFSKSGLLGELYQFVVFVKIQARCHRLRRGR